jgi:hypothetical protein
MVALGWFDRFRAPQLRMTFTQSEPWCREGVHPRDGRVVWVRIGVENAGTQPARGCVGRLTEVWTDGSLRIDIDPVQLRWAGVPRSRSFDPFDVRRGQREFLDVLYLHDRDNWKIVTFEEADFDPGFTTELVTDRAHLLHVSVFADNANTVSRKLSVALGSDGAMSISLEGGARQK